jgi:hypothetical protein
VEVGINSLHTNMTLARLEVTFDVVVAQTPAATVSLGAHLAKRLEHLEQAYIFMALALHKRERVIRSNRVDREMFVGAGSGEKQRRE